MIPANRAPFHKRPLDESQLPGVKEIGPGFEAGSGHAHPGPRQPQRKRFIVGSQCGTFDRWPCPGDREEGNHHVHRSR